MFQIFNFCFFSRKDRQKLREEAGPTVIPPGKILPCKMLWMSEIDPPKPPKTVGHLTVLDGGRDELVRQAAQAIYFRKETTLDAIRQRLKRVDRNISGIRAASLNGKTL